MNLVVKRIAALIIKQWRGELTVEETIELEQWVDENPHNRDLLQQLTQDETLRQELITYYEAENAKDAVWKKIEGAITPIIPFPVQHTKKYRYLAAAVTTAAILTIVAYFWIQNKPRPAKQIVQTTSNDVSPGGNKAILKLSDGKTIVLDDAQNGLLAEQGAVQIEKQEGQLSYSPSATTTAVLYNTLATPAGGQFQLKLPDGTRVWLNASSSITYPTAFVGKERRVTITGEGYFEVAKDAHKPFKVTIQSATGEKRPAEVEVLGTHFNINAYDDEAAVKTTLLEGRVKVVNRQSAIGNEKSVVLAPGEQAIASAYSPRPDGPVGQALTINHSPDLEEVVAWKNGEFLFQSADISTLMRQVARWYDIEISYPDGKPKDKFSGKIGRNVNLSQLLKILEYSEVRFELKGRTLVVKN
jgi:ferric-dicitrate binding protein FerR (iron transport regulator)